MKRERWKWIPRYERLYKVSDKGRVKSYYRRGTHGRETISTGKLMKLSLSPKFCPYVIIRLCKEKACVAFLVHRLVLLAFVGPCPIGHECAHYNGDPTNNCLENLRWATPKENVADTIRHGRLGKARGESHGCAKLTRRQVKRIRKQYVKGDTSYREIAEDYGVHLTTIRNIIKRVCWT